MIMDGNNTPSIFKLDIDCFEELFEYLPLKVLFTLRQTNKRFKQLVDYFIKEYYPAIKPGYANTSCIDFGDFHNYVRNNEPLIKEVYIGEFDDEEIAEIRVLLSGIEMLRVANRVTGDFYNLYLQFCGHLKRLEVEYISGDEIWGDRNDWLLREYPKLEYVEFDDFDPYPHDRVGDAVYVTEIREVKIFFEMNPNIRTFSTTFTFLFINRRCFIGSNISFDLLKINGGCENDYGAECGVNPNQIVALLKTLYEQGFYKRLFFETHCSHGRDDEIWNEIPALPALESIWLFDKKIMLSSLVSSLKELDLRYFAPENVTKELACNLLNVERISSEGVCIADILPFVRYSRKVKEIRMSSRIFENAIIDVAALNQERQKLPGACNQTIYVKEEIFLTTKLAGVPTMCSSVQLKRFVASLWRPQSHEFYDKI